MQVVVAVWSFLFGLVLGSFYNVVIYRLPRGLSFSETGLQLSQVRASFECLGACSYSEFLVAARCM